MSLDFPTVTPTELRRLLAANPQLALLDVRTPAEYAEGHVPQARNEELDTLRPAELFARKVLSSGQPIYLICRTENRARKAAVKFADAGHAQVTIVAGGTLGWIAAALPVSTEPKATPAATGGQPGLASVAVPQRAPAPAPRPWAGLLAALLLCALSARLLAQDHLLNASFDVSRELFQEINPAFATQWKAGTGRDIQIRQSHVGSSQQARAVLDGLPADVVTLNQVSDVDLLAAAHLIAADWRSRLPDHAAPYTSVTAFVVNAGNPKQIRDWDDLVRPGIRVSPVNPKTSGNGRYTFLAAWAFGLRHFGGDVAKTRAFVGELYQHVPALAQGGRAATTIFAERGLADVLITFESEARVLETGVNGRKFTLVAPSATLLVEFPVSVVDRVVDRDGNRKAAEAYLRFLYTDAGQRIIAAHGFRPRTGGPASAAAPSSSILDVDAVFGGWPQVQQQFFADGAIFDQIIEKTY